MYFKSRTDAGKQLTQKLITYKYTPNVVIALSDGGVLVGNEIAKTFNSLLTMLLLEPVKIPGEPDTLLSIREDGKYTYNQMWSTGELEELEAEYRTYLDQAKREKYSELRRALGVSCLASSDLLHNKNIILVSDGLKNGNSIDAAADFLKPVKHLKLIVAVPFATAAALDKMRLMADEVHCLDIVANYLTTDHYYEDKTLPSHAKIVKAVEHDLFH